jgi:hypothetical protein
MDVKSEIDERRDHIVDRRGHGSYAPQLGRRCRTEPGQ